MGTQGRGWLRRVCLAGIMFATVWALFRPRGSEIAVTTAWGTILALIPVGVDVRESRRRDAVLGAPPIEVLAGMAKNRLGERRRRLLGDFGPGGTHPVNLDFRRIGGPPQSSGSPQAPETGKFDAILDYYDSVPSRRLVITGGVGAGKTMLASELALALLERRGPDDPVPVRLSLPGWSGSQDSRDADAFTRWIRKSLAVEYKLEPLEAQAFVTARKILPVLDGLDEMDPDEADPAGSRAADLLRALDVWLDGRQGVPYVLTCRTDWYDRLVQAGESPHGVTRVELDLVAPVDAVGHLRAVPKRHPERWDSLFQELEARPTGQLATALDTPWRLTLVAGLYAEEGDPAELLSCPDADSLRNHLLGRYVSAASRTHPAGTADDTYDSADVHRWLAWIAKGLGTRGEFTPHGMWRLIPTGRTRAVEAALAAVPWVLLTALCTVVARSNDTAAVAASLLGGGCALVLFQCLREAKPIVLPVVRRRSRKQARRSLRLATTVYGAVMAGLALALFLLLDERTRAYVELIRSGAGTEGEVRVDAWRYLLFALTALIGAALLVVYLILVLLQLPAALFGMSLVPFYEAPSALRDPGYPLTYERRVAKGLSAIFGVSLIVAVFGGVPVSTVVVALPIAHVLLLTLAPTAPRHMAFRLCTRGQLPPRLAPFLNWSREAGLLRLSGSAYEFRHRELQDWLAANPEPGQ